MARKRSTPIDEPPSATSEAEEEEPQKKVRSSTSEGKVQSSSDKDSRPRSESESDLAQPSLILVKPISSKPMDDPPKFKKPRSKLARPSTNRPIDKDMVAADAKDSNRAKKGVEVEGEASKSGEHDTKKKALFERIFQQEDEVTILRGMLDYSSKNGVGPVADIDGFYQHIKKKLVQVDFNRDQLLDKMKRMRKKFVNNARKGKQGVDRTFSKGIEQESYYLSKNLWGNEGINLGGAVKVVDHANLNGKAKQKSQTTEDSKDGLLASIRATIDEESDKRQVLKQDSGPSNSFWINKSFVSCGLDESFMKEGMGLIDDATKSELEEKWRELLIDEAEIFQRRIALVREQTMLALDAFKMQKFF